LYELDLAEGNHKKVDTIDVKKEAEQAGQEPYDEFDIISDLRFINDGKALRIT